MALSLDDIKYFITVSETENVTRASEKLGITQPTLSYTLKRLENELKGELLIRLKSGIKLTKMGEEFLKRSHRLVYEWEQAQKAADPQLGLTESSYTIAIHPSVALYTLKSFLPKLAKKFPKVHFNFVHGLSREMTEKVISWEADFGIVVNPIKHPDLVISKLCLDEVSLFFKKGCPNKLIFDENLAQTQFILKKMKSKKFECHLVSGNLEVVAKLTSLGLGYGVLPSRVAAHYSFFK